MIIAGRCLLPAADTSVELANAWVRVADGRIAEVHRGSPPAPADITAPYVFPGFVDAHAHLPQFDAIGASGLPLLDWLEAVVFPAETRWSDAAFAAAMTHRCADRFLRAGTTTAAVYATVHAEATQAAIRVLGDRQLRAHVGHVLMDRRAPEALTPPLASQIAEHRALADHKRAAVSVAPRFAVSCTDECLRYAGELAAERQALVQTHLAENCAEVDTVAADHPGRTYTEVYHDAGLLHTRSVLAHAIWLTEQDRSLLASAGAVVAHCPTANQFLMSGDADIHAMRTNAIRVAIGSDIAGGPIVSMPRVARHALEIHKRLHGREGAQDAATYWHAITAGNAQAIACSHSGSLAPGADADLLLVHPDEDALAARHLWPDELGYLLHAWNDRWITKTYCMGEDVTPR